MPFLAQGGGHGWAPSLHKVQRAVLVDLSRVNTVTHDNSTQIITVGGGALAGDVVKSLSDAGRETSKPEPLTPKTGYNRTKVRISGSILSVRWNGWRNAWRWPRTASRVAWSYYR